MTKIFSTLKSMARSLSVLLAITLLVFTTACSGSANALERQQAPTRKDAITPGQVQSYEGGMNNFSDVDKTRLDTSKVDAKAKALKDRVDRNLDEKRIDSVDQYVENYRTGTPLGERTARFGKDIRKGVENFADDAKDASGRFGEETSQTTDRLSDRSGRAFENAKANTRDAGKDLVQDTKQAVNKTANFAKDKANDAANAAKGALNNID